jgi:hypothetical protein
VAVYIPHDGVSRFEQTGRFGKRKRVATFLLQPFDLLVERGLEVIYIYLNYIYIFVKKFVGIRLCIHFLESFAFSSPLSLALVSVETRSSPRLRRPVSCVGPCRLRAGSSFTMAHP